MDNKEEIKNKKASFIKSAKDVKEIFEKANIKLNFSNYNNTINDYLSSDENDIVTLNNLMKDLNFWSDYFGSLEGLSTSLLLKYENKKLYVESFPKSMENLKIIDRLTFDIRKLKLFVKHLRIQKTMFSDFYFHCYELYDSANENMCFRYMDY